MSSKYTKPSEITTVGSGDGSELSQYNSPFGLITSDGSGNPPAEIGSVSTMNYYNKDLDLVQNMRNLFSLVSGFKETLDNIVTASGYGGWTIMTSYIYPQDRIPGLMYLNATLQYSDTDEECTDPDGNLIPIWKIRAEVVDKYGNVNTDLPTQKLGILKFASDADIVHYNKKNSYGMTSTNVEAALDELSQRTIILKATLLFGAWTFVEVEKTPNQQGESYYYQEVEVPGMRNTDYPIVTLNTENCKDESIESAMDTYNVKVQLRNVGRIARIQTLNGKIRAYCYGEPPQVALPLIFRVIRGNNPGEL